MFLRASAEVLLGFYRHRRMMNRVARSVLLLLLAPRFTPVRHKTTSATHVASRAMDLVLEKHMSSYKNLVKVLQVQDLILASPRRDPPSVSLNFLSRLSQRLRLNPTAPAFLRRYPHVFHLYYDPATSLPACRLTDSAVHLSRLEAEAIRVSLPVVIDRLVRILSMSVTRSVPLRAVFKVWRELGLPDDFEDSVIRANPSVFALRPGAEPNTHVLELLGGGGEGFSAAVDEWRLRECCGEECDANRMEMRFAFGHRYPPGMRLSKRFKDKVAEWQGLPYFGPYEELRETKRTKAGLMRLEKRAVAVVHEFLSLTVEKMVEVEKISHFRKCFRIDFNIRDLFLDHPGMFYLSTKGKRHTVFLREAFERDRLVDPNPVYDVRRKLLHLVMMGRRGLAPRSKPAEADGNAAA